ncbi:MAG TPA: hypothetical protein ENK78_01165, partial [Thiothrix sp.]|nr:hypothetical protein [Thiothrix sp.]
MDIHLLYQFFLWCTLINGAVFLISALAWMIYPNMLYRLQTYWFSMPRDDFNKNFYLLLGLFKLLWLIFNVTPLIALSI